MSNDALKIDSVMARRVTVLLDEVERFFSNLSARDEKKVARVLEAIWGQLMRGEDNGFDDATLRTAGIAKAIADEWNLNGDFS